MSDIYKILEEMYNNNNFPNGIDVLTLQLLYEEDKIKVKLQFVPYVITDEGKIYHNLDSLDNYDIYIVDEYNRLYDLDNLPKDIKNVYLFIISKDKQKWSKVFKIA